MLLVKDSLRCYETLRRIIIQPFEFDEFELRLAVGRGGGRNIWIASENVKVFFDRTICDCRSLWWNLREDCLCLSLGDLIQRLLATRGIATD